MSFTKNRYDSCFMNQQAQSNKSIFDYVVDKSMYKNENECNNYTAPFLTYIPSGVTSKNVDIENDLKGMTRLNTKCINCKFTPDEEELQLPQIQTNKKLYDQFPNNKSECDMKHNILPQGYLPNKRK